LLKATTMYYLNKICACASVYVCVKNLEY
jgi:hypothetical protein